MSKESRLVHNVRNRTPEERIMAMKSGDNSEKLLTPSEVAALFRVDPKTVTRWAKAGKLSSIRTLGGHRRYRESEIRELIEVSSQE
jgi:excisionase family DNA binding protein